MRLPIFDPHLWVESIARLIAGWKAFWFTPADPLVLGLQRIGAGLVLVYVMVATTPLLSSLFAHDAFIDAETANRFRKEIPVEIPPESWQRPEPPPRPNDEKGAQPPRNLRPAIRPHRINDRAYFDRWNIDPAILYDEGAVQFSPFFHLKSSRWMLLIHGLGLVVAILFTLGLGTRIVGVLAWIVALSYMHRIMFAQFGMDTMLAISLFYLMISPCGARLSLDRLIQRYRRGRFALCHHVPVSMEVAPSIAANVALRLFQIHFCIIYFNSGISKLQGAAWWNGTAIWQTMSTFEFTPMQSTLFLEGLRFLTHHRWLWEIVMTSGDVFTIFLELGLPFLIWYPRWRPIMLIGAVLLHTGIALTMGMTSFSLLMVIIVAGFLPTATVRDWIDRLVMGSRTYTLLVSVRERVGVRLAALVQAVDVGDQIRIVDISTRTPGDGDWPAHLDGSQLGSPSGQTYHGYAIFERLTRGLRLLWPIGLLTWIPGVAQLGRLIAPAEPRAREPETAGVGR